MCGGTSFGGNQPCRIVTRRICHKPKGNRDIDQQPRPRVLLTTGLNDARVAAWHSLKMAAGLQAAPAEFHPNLSSRHGRRQRCGFGLLFRTRKRPSASAAPVTCTVATSSKRSNG
ncbi:MAG: prolyl oligopeptidase family serine peptidase [Chthoniobacterales bacterium]